MTEEARALFRRWRRTIQIARYLDNNDEEVEDLPEPPKASPEGIIALLAMATIIIAGFIFLLTW